MCAKILSFTRRPIPPPVAGKTVTSPSIEQRWVQHYLPIVRVALELQDCNRDEFEGRCREMLDTPGRALADELCDEMKTVEGHLEEILGSLVLARGRVKAAMARLQAKEP